MIDWTPLRACLSQCRANHFDLPFWWRDDDAVAPTSALERLIDLSDETGVPLHLAIIPAFAQADLGPALHAHTDVHPIVHGWRHENHAPQGEKSCEFGQTNPNRAAQAKAALEKMRALFGPRLLPLFVPPWNRVAPDVLADLAQIAYGGVSTFGPRASGLPLPAINTHIDPIFWRGTRSLVPAEQLIATTVSHIEARRRGIEDAREPLGFLTHHLVHDAAIWDFSRQFLIEMRSGGASIATIREHMT